MDYRDACQNAWWDFNLVEQAWLKLDDAVQVSKYKYIHEQNN